MGYLMIQCYDNFLKSWYEYKNGNVFEYVN